MDKEITFEEFSKEVDKWWADDTYKYGSAYFAARKAEQEFISLGITNTKEIFEQYYLKNKGWLHYAGD